MSKTEATIRFYKRNQNRIVPIPEVYWEPCQISEIELFAKIVNGYTHCTKIETFPIKISSVNVIKSAVSYGFGDIYWRKPWWKTLFFVQRHLWLLTKNCIPEVAIQGMVLNPIQDGGKKAPYQFFTYNFYKHRN